MVKLEKELVELTGFNYSISDRTRYDNIIIEKSKLVNETNMIIDELNLKSGDFKNFNVNYSTLLKNCNTWLFEFL